MLNEFPAMSASHQPSMRLFTAKFLSLHFIHRFARYKHLKSMNIINLTNRNRTIFFVKAVRKFANPVNGFTGFFRATPPALILPNFDIWQMSKSPPGQPAPKKTGKSVHRIREFPHRFYEKYGSEFHKCIISK